MEKDRERMCVCTCRHTIQSVLRMEECTCNILLNEDFVNLISVMVGLVHL